MTKGLSKHARHLIRKAWKMSWYSETRDYLEEREGLKRRIDELAEHGMICVLESGRDCDGVEYGGITYTISATVTHYEGLQRDIGMAADGPFRLRIIRCSEEGQHKYWSRDRGAEAFENGHAHVIYSSI